MLDPAGRPMSGVAILIVCLFGIWLVGRIIKLWCRRHREVGRGFDRSRVGGRFTSKLRGSNACHGAAASGLS